MPPVQAIIQQSHWPQRIRAIVNFVACGIAAVGVAYFEGTVNWHDWIRAFLVVLVATIATYHGQWKPTGIAPWVEQKTSTKEA